MLHARGNLDLESPEELLTSSDTLGPRPLWAHSFWALHFCIIFRDFVLYGFSMHFWWMTTSCLASFFMLLHHFFGHHLYMDLSSLLSGSLCICWNSFVDFHGPTSNWRNLHKHLFLLYFCMVNFFANTWFFINFQTCVAAVCCIIFILGSFWYTFGIKTTVCSRPNF